ncbi:MAG TPA: DUF222 domain-containing protein [Acidimicrobiales bacterium]|nr:DUF222 domain-containing protein [Acidimicrobiales bacterium]
MSIEALVEAIDELVAETACAHSDADSVKCLVRQLTRLESVTTSAVAAFDASGDWSAEGAKTAAAWISTVCHLPRPMGRRMVRRARHLRHLPVVAQAFEEGAIAAAHVDTVANLRRDGTEEALARDEAMIVQQAKRLRFEQFTRAAAYWDQLADPDGTEDIAEARRARRDVYLEPSMHGMYLGQMTLDPISGSIVATELNRIERELFKADWAKAREELGHDPNVENLCRTSAQRRADALVEMAARSSVVDAESVRRPAPLFSVLVDWPTLSGRVCELAEGIVVSPGELVDWLSVADLERAVMEPSGRVEVSPKQRLFTGATRRAIELRDRECSHPFCDEPGTRCQADHITPWAASGETTQENGRLLCGFHNRLRNQRPPPQRE